MWLRFTLRDGTNYGPNGDGTAVVTVGPITIDNTALPSIAISITNGPAMIGERTDLEWHFMEGDTFEFAVTAHGHLPGHSLSLHAAHTGGTLNSVGQAGFYTPATFPISVSSATPAVSPPSLEWTGRPTIAGTFELTLTAEMGGYSDTVRITLVVVKYDQPPVIWAPVGLPPTSGSPPHLTVTISPSHSLAFSIRATGANLQQVVTFTATIVGGTLSASAAGFTTAFPHSLSAPSEVILAFTGTAQSTPGFLDIEFLADGGQFQSTLTLTIYIGTNNTPAFDRPTGPGTVTGTGPGYSGHVPPAGSLDFSVTATDLDAFDTLTITATITHAGSIHNPVAAGFTTPFPHVVAGSSPLTISFQGQAQISGTINLHILADDGRGGQATISVTVHLQVNQPVVIGAPTGPGSVSGTWPNFDTTVDIGDSLAFSITATDADATDIVGLQVGVSPNSPQQPVPLGFTGSFPKSATGVGSATVNVTGTAAQPGVVIFLITSPTANHNVLLTVTILGHTVPTLVCPGAAGTAPNYTKSVAVGKSISFSITASDPDPGDILTLTGAVTGGSLTAAEAGLLTPSFPWQSVGASPRSHGFNGTAAAVGTVVFTFVVFDSTNQTATITLTVDIRSSDPPTHGVPVVTTHTLHGAEPDYEIDVNVGDPIEIHFTATDTDSPTITVQVNLISSSWHWSLPHGLNLNPGSDSRSISGAVPVTNTIFGYAPRPGFMNLSVRATDPDNNHVYIYFRINIGHPPEIALAASGSQSGDDSALTLRVSVGDPLSIVATITDPDGDPVNDLLAVEWMQTGGTISAITAGFTMPLPWQIFAPSPVTVDLTGIAAAVGSVGLTLRAVDVAGNLTMVSVTVIIDDATGAPIIENVTPRLLRAGISAVIMGRQFGSTPAANTVTVGGETAVVTSAEPDMLVVAVPSAVTSGAITVTANGYTSDPWAVEWGPQRLSVDVAGNEIAADAVPTAISADGRFVVFHTTAALVPADTNGVADVYWRDTIAGTLVLVSANPAGVAGNGASRNGRVSADGRFVAFESAATDLIADDTNGADDVFVRNIAGDTTVCVSRVPYGPLGNGHSRRPAISACGRWIAFESTASNLVFNDTNGFSDIFVADRETGICELISVNSFGGATNGDSTAPDISANGQRIAFVSTASNLHSPDANGLADVFVFDRPTAKTRMMSRTGNGLVGNGPSDAIRISADGNVVAFTSLASNLVTNDTNGVQDVFVRVWDESFLRRVNRPEGYPGAPQQSAEPAFAPSISADGQFVAYLSAATDLKWEPKTTPYLDVFVWDRLDNAQHRISASVDGTEADGDSMAPLISADGAMVVAASAAANLIAGDTNGTADVFFLPRPTYLRPVTAILAADDSWLRVDAHTTIVGFGFGTDPARIAVTVGGAAADIVEIDNTRIRIRIPIGAHVMGHAGTNLGTLTARQVTHELGATVAHQLTPMVASQSNIERALGGHSAQISGNGRFVVFASDSPDHVPNDTNGATDIFVRDLNAHTTARVSLDMFGVQATGDSFTPRISADGRFIVFRSVAPLTANDTNGLDDVYLYDRRTLQTTRISTPATDGASFDPDVSFDGRFVVFASDASDLVSDDTNDVRDVFVFDRILGTMERVSLNSFDIAANGDCDTPAISADGRFVAFLSTATNLVGGDTNGVADVFVRDRLSGMTRRLHASRTGAEADAAAFGAVSLDWAGRRAAFTSAATTLTPADTNAISDAYVTAIGK